MVIDIFYILFTLRYNIKLNNDSNENMQYRRDIFYMMMLRFMVNMWLFSNFLFYGCCMKNVQLQELEGLDEEDFENLR